MITLTKLALLICSLNVSMPGSKPLYTQEECRERASEYIYAASLYSRVNVLELLAIDIHECNLREDKHLPYFNYRQNKHGKTIKILKAIDLCPMGLRIAKIRKRSDWQIPRREIVVRAAGLLNDYKKHYFRKPRRKRKHYKYFGHYNWGYRVFIKGKHALYDDKVTIIYRTLRKKRTWRVRDKRTMRIVRIIRKVINELSY